MDPGALPDTSSPPGIDLLAAAGAERISFAFEADTPAASHLYLSVGFEPHRQTDVLARKAVEASSSPVNEVGPAAVAKSAGDRHRGGFSNGVG